MGEQAPRRRGNPVTIRRGELVRASLVGLLAINTEEPKPMAIETLCEFLNVDKTGVLRHLAILQDAGRIKGYTSARGMVRVWK